MESKVVRIFGPASEVDAFVKQIANAPHIYVQHFTLDDIELEMRLNVVLWHAQRAKEASQVAREFEERILRMLRKAGV